MASKQPRTSMEGRKPWHYWAVSRRCRAQSGKQSHNRYGIAMRSLEKKESKRRRFGLLLCALVPDGKRLAKAHGNIVKCSGMRKALRKETGSKISAWSISTNRVYEVIVRSLFPSPTRNFDQLQPFITQLPQGSIAIMPSFPKARGVSIRDGTL